MFKEDIDCIYIPIIAYDDKQKSHRTSKHKRPQLADISYINIPLLGFCIYRVDIHLNLFVFFLILCNLLCQFCLKCSFSF